MRGAADRARSWRGHRQPHRRAAAPEVAACGRRVWQRTVVGVSAASAVLVVGAFGGCDSGGDTLPGRSRPIFEHGWPDPSELALGPSAFTPLDPADALFETSSGGRAYIVPGADSDPLVRLTAALPLGRLHEAEDEAGASALLTRLLTTRSPIGARRPLSLLLAELGTSLTTVETLDAVHISLHVLPEDWQAGLELLIALVRNPDLDAAAIREHRAGPGYTMPMAGIAGAGFRPKVELERRIQGYPLAPPDPGTTVSPASARALAARALAADRVVFGVGGPVPRDEVEATLEAATRGWAPRSGPAGPGAGEPSPQPAVIEPREPQTRFHAVDVPSLEGWIAIGRAISAVTESDRAALAVLRFVLAERLNIAAREVRGLANRDDFEMPETGSGTGLLLVRTGGRPEAVAPLVRYSLDEIVRMHDPDEPVTESEVARAKGWVVDAVWRRSLELPTTASVTFAVEHVRRGSTARLMAWPAAVGAVTAEDVKAVAQAYLDPATFVTVVAGPLARIRAARHPRWPVALDELEADLTGTRIVESTSAAWPPGEEWRVDPESVFRLGADEDDPPSQFFRILDVALLASGDVIVVDGGRSEVRRYDAGGRHLWSAGGRGEGPGEFRSPRYLGRREDGAFLIWDRSLSRLSVLGEQGDLIAAERPSFGSEFVAQGLFDDGTWLVTFPESIAAPEAGTTWADTVGLWRYDPVRRDRTQLATMLGQRWIWTGRHMLPVPFSPRPLRAIDGTRLAVASGPDAQVSLHDAAGSLVARYRVVRDRMDIPRYQPAFDQLLTEPDGAIWARRFRSDPLSHVPTTWDVFDRTGVYLGPVSTPGGLTVLAVRDGLLAGVYRDELGVEYVSVHRVVGGIG